MSRNQSELLTLTRRVEAARQALHLDSDKWGPNSQVPKGEIPAALMPGQYHSPALKRTKHRILEMRGSPKELLTQVTVPGEDIQAIAALEVLKQAAEEFMVSIDQRKFT